MKRHYIRVRVSVPPYPPPGEGYHFRITDVSTGRPLEMAIPHGYAVAFYAARPGDRIKASIFGDPKRIRYSRHRRERRRIRTTPVCFRVVSVEIQDATA